MSGEPSAGWTGFWPEEVGFSWRVTSTVTLVTMALMRSSDMAPPPSLSLDGLAPVPDFRARFAGLDALTSGACVEGRLERWERLGGICKRNKNKRGT